MVQPEQAEILPRMRPVGCSTVVMAEALMSLPTFVQVVPPSSDCSICTVPVPAEMTVWKVMAWGRFVSKRMILVEVAWALAATKREPS